MRGCHVSMHKGGSGGEVTIGVALEGHKGCSIRGGTEGARAEHGVVGGPRGGATLMAVWQKGGAKGGQGRACFCRIVLPI